MASFVRGERPSYIARMGGGLIELILDCKNMENLRRGHRLPHLDWITFRCRQNPGHALFDSVINRSRVSGRPNHTGSGKYRKGGGWTWERQGRQGSVILFLYIYISRLLPDRCHSKPSYSQYSLLQTLQKLSQGEFWPSFYPSIFPPGLTLTTEQWLNVEDLHLINIYPLEKRRTLTCSVHRNNGRSWELSATIYQVLGAGISNKN